MMRSICIAVLVFSVSGSEAFAQSFQDSIRREASRAAAQQSQSQPTKNPIPAAYLWSGIGLMAGGAAYIAVGSVFQSSDPCAQYRSSSYSCVSNYDPDVLTVIRVLGAGAIVTGATLLIVGTHKRDSASPEIVATRRGLAIRTRLTF